MKLLVAVACCVLLMSTVNVNGKPPHSSESVESIESAESVEATVAGYVEAVTNVPGAAPAKAAQSSESDESSEECYNEGCARIILPVCGSNGPITKKFDNECEMRVASCVEKTNYKEVSIHGCPP